MRGHNKKIARFHNHVWLEVRLGRMNTRVANGSTKFPTVGRHCKTQAQLLGSLLGQRGDPTKGLLEILEQHSLHNELRDTVATKLST